MAITCKHCLASREVQKLLREKHATHLQQTRLYSKNQCAKDARAFAENMEKHGAEILKGMTEYRALHIG